MMHTIRSSRVPLEMACAASIVPPTLRIESAGKPAAIGTAAHTIYAQAILSGRIDDDQITALATTEDLPISEIRYLANVGMMCWRQVESLFPNPATEVGVSATHDGVVITGHLDVMSIVGTQFRCADFKTGREDKDHLDQLRAYCWIGLQNHPECDSAYGCIIRPRERDIEGQQWTRAALATWFQDLKTQLDHPQVFTPGDHCGFCPRVHECPARAARLNSLVDALVGEVELPSDPAIRATALVNWLGAVKDIEYAATALREQIRAEVRAAGGRIESADGRVLQIDELTKRQVIPGEATTKILREFMAQDQIDAATTLSKTKLEAAVSDNSPRGQKKARIEAFLDELESAGRIALKTEERLNAKRAVKQVEVMQ